MRTAVKQGVSNCSYVFLPQTGKGPRKPNIMTEKQNKINELSNDRTIQTDEHPKQLLSFRPQGEICFASIYDNSRFLTAVEMTISWCDGQPDLHRIRLNRTPNRPLQNPDRLGHRFQTPGSSSAIYRSRALSESKIAALKEQIMKPFSLVVLLELLVISGCASTSDATQTASLARRCKVTIATDAGANDQDPDKAEARARLAASQLQMMQLRSGNVRSDLVDDLLRDC
jgi:hypothetical protein